MSLRRTLVVALFCALPFSHAFAAEETAAPTIKWVLPWKSGTTLEYASEDLTTSDLTKRERTRSTSTATVRITEATKQGFVQSWSWAGGTYVVEEGDKAGEAQMREFATAMKDVTLEVELDADGNYARLRNLAEITTRLRPAMQPLMRAGIDANLAKITDAAKRDEARKAAMAKVDGVMDRMLAPAVLETMLTRNTQWYNAFVGIDIEPDQNYEAKLEVANPVGGAPIPVTITFSISVSEEDPDDLFVDFEQKIDRENGGAAATAMIEGLLGTPLPKDQKPLEISITDAGLFVVHRPTGVVEMFEATRTVQAGDQSKVERHRLRLTNGEHAHVWTDAQDEASAPAAEVQACANSSAPQEAIAACSELIRSGVITDRELGNARFDRAAAYSQTGAQDKALVDLDEALRLLPGDARVHGMRGVVHGRKGELDAAIADFSTSIEADPSLVDSITNRGKALQDKGEFARALPDFDRALKLQPENAFALNGRCWSRAVLNIDLDAALADCNAGVEAGGVELGNTLNTRGFVHYRRGEYREAIASYDASLERNPIASSYYVRGLSKRALGEPGADADIAKALSLETGVRERYAGYGVAP